MMVAPLLDYPSTVMIANALGYMSIGCWLCAQLPQVIKNASLRSCEGLALPFLCSWLFGDITNLIGCLLTDQLPFQTYLAIYFCAIDFALVGQYIHYKRPSQATRIPSSATQTPRYVSYNTLVSSPHQSLILPPATAPPIRTRSSSGNFLPSSTSAPNTARPRPKRNNNYPSTTNIHNLPPPDINLTTSSPADGSYAAIYEAALDVARAAERASHRRSRSKRRKLSRQASTSNEYEEDANGYNEDLADSFHSELSTRSSSTIGGGAGGDHGDRNRLTQSTGTLLGDRRGRSMTRTNTRSPIIGQQGQLSPLPNQHRNESDNLDGLPSSGTLGLILGGNGELQMRESKRSQSRSLSLARGSGGRGGRRAAGVAFMSLGLLVGFGGFGGSARSIGGPSGSVGRVLVEPTGVITNWHKPSTSPSAISSYSSRQQIDTSSQGYISSIPESNYIITDFLEPPIISEKESPPHLPEEPPSFQRIIGRISAWACTTLYLASRLPQIWKNFQRKSVEGLSILLFLMAFLGNVTYVSSILLNPAGGGDPSEAGHYLLEALPYLLGSGGTLIFDLTIMIQSLIYGSAPPLPIPPTPMDRNSRRRGLFSNKKRIKHIEDGSLNNHNHNHTYNQIHNHYGFSHSRSHSYTQQHPHSSERAPLLPSANISQTQNNGLGIIGLDSNINSNRSTSRSRSRSKSPDKKIVEDSGQRGRSKKRSIDADVNLDQGGER